MDGKLSLMMYIVTYRHSRNKRRGEVRRGGIGLGLRGVRTLSRRYDPLYKISWSSTYLFVS